MLIDTFIDILIKVIRSISFVLIVTIIVRSSVIVMRLIVDVFITILLVCFLVTQLN